MNESEVLTEAAFTSALASTRQAGHDTVILHVGFPPARFAATFLEARW